MSVNGPSQTISEIAQRTSVAPPISQPTGMHGHPDDFHNDLDWTMRLKSWNGLEARKVKILVLKCKFWDYPHTSGKSPWLELYQPPIPPPTTNPGSSENIE